jgi:hypothetical protein
MIKQLLGLKKRYKYKVAICCIVKNEDVYFQEWIDYHIKIGVSHFYIYDNESVNPVNNVVDHYIKQGLVTVEIIKGTEKQMTAYSDCLKKYKNECQWLAFIDVDEFIVAKTLNGNLPEFLTQYERYGGVGINWLIFGSNGHKDKPNGSQIDNFTRRSLKTNPVNGHIKSIVQTRYVKKTGPDPHQFKYKYMKYFVNENFERLNGPIVKHTSNKIQINHYFLRSKEEFRIKVSRGRADCNVPRKMQEFDDTDKDANYILDESIKEIIILADAAERESAN